MSITIETGSDGRDDLCPFCDSEIPAAMKRIAAHRSLEDMVRYAFPGTDIEEIRRQLLAITTADEFQHLFVKKQLYSIIKSSMSAFTTGGTENLHNGGGHLFITNHRDIVLDGALLQLMLIEEKLPTSEISFGSNLVSSDFVEDFGKCNKMYKILRGGSARDLVRNSRTLSQHLRDVVGEGRSIWISQRDGRTKDGDDRTDQGLLKMFTMTGGDDIYASLKGLNILPAAISYEYESCDALKAKEIYFSRRGPYIKSPGEDMHSIITGVKQYKGEVHLEACKPITADEIDALTGDNNNDILRRMAALIDSRIIGAYKLYNTNYMAYDLKGGTDTFADRYSREEREEFTDYLRTQAAKTDGDMDELTDILLDIYANPVKNKMENAELKMEN